MTDTAEFERRFAMHCDATYCIAVSDLPRAITLSLHWWAKRQRWLAMEADVFATQQLRIEVPKLAGDAPAIAAASCGISVMRTDERVRGSYQLYPSPVWVGPHQALCVDYRTVNASTRGTTERALVCITPSAAGMTAAILTNDGEAAAWLQAQIAVPQPETSNG